MRRMTSLICAAALTALLHHPANQGVPAPISGTEIDRYAQWLNLSREQHYALAVRHQQYLITFRDELGSAGEPIERYLALQREVGDVPFTVPTTNALNGFINHHRQVFNDVPAPAT